MKIEKFVPKPQFEFEAVEFTGGIDNGRDLMVWIIGGNGSAVWMEEDLGEWNRCGMREHIRIFKGSASTYAYIGDYIIKDETGEFKPCRRAIFNSLYSRSSNLEEVVL